jgi:NTE family protein
MDNPDRRIGLVLSGGLAWGLAHIGVLQVLEQEDIQVDVIAGTSVGSLVGALYASGYKSADLLTLAHDTHWWDIVSLQRPYLGLLGMERFEAYLAKHIGRRTFSQLQLPFAAVACDLSSGAEIIITSGSVCTAVRASCTIPGIFTPVQVEGKLLIDGGVVNNLPVDVARSLGAQKVIAVDLGAQTLGWEPPEHIFQVIIQTIILMQRANVAAQLPKADLIIQPVVTKLSLLDLDHPQSYIEAGRQAAQAVLSQLKSFASMR